MNRYNSTFKIREGAKQLKRTQLRRRRESVKQSKVRINKRGRRTKEWESVWRWLKPRLEAASRTRCEFHFIEHVCDGPLDPAHSKKRRKMEGNDIYAVAIACRNVHNFLDYKCTHEEMQAFVEEAINLAGGLILPEKLAA